jgi:hypothetical protein
MIERTITFSSDCTRKWQSLWLVGEILERSLQGALKSRRMFVSVSEHGVGNNPPLHIHLIYENWGKCNQMVQTLACNHPSLLCPDETRLEQIALIYHGMKRINTLSFSSL